MPRDFCSNIEYSSFNGKLVSLTWRRYERLVFVVNGDVFAFNLEGLNATELDVFRLWSLPDPTTMDMVGRNDLLGYYIISPNDEPNSVHLLEDRDGLVVTRKLVEPKTTVMGEGNIVVLESATHGDQTVLGEYPLPRPISLVHDSHPSKPATAWAFGKLLLYTIIFVQPLFCCTTMSSTITTTTTTDYNKLTKQMMIGDLAFNVEKGYEPALGEDFTRWSRYFVTITAGELVLYAELAAAPKEGSPFGRLPQGFVWADRQLLYLFDDDKGCVYTVQGWSAETATLKRNKMDLKQEVLKFPVTGTTYEHFFHRCLGEGMTVDAALAADRCNTKVPLVHGVTRSRGGLGGGGFLLLMVMGAFLVAILAFFVCKRGKSGGGGGGGSKKSGKKSTKQDLVTLKGTSSTASASAAGKSTANSAANSSTPSSAAPPAKGK